MQIASSVLALFFCLISLVLAAPADVRSQEAQCSGEGTFYFPAGGYGACGSILNDNDAIVALAVDQYDAIGCGSCIQVNGPNGFVKLTVADKVNSLSLLVWCRT